MKVAEGNMCVLLSRILFIMLLIVISTGCGQISTGSANPSSPSTPSANCVSTAQPSFAYVLNDWDATVSMYTVNSCTGVLDPTTPATVPTGVNNGFNAETMAVDPTGRFLYVANLGSNATDTATISMFTINPKTGILTATTPPTVPTGFLPQGIAASANFVYTANSDDNSVSMFTINKNNGLLAPLVPAETLVPPLFTSRSSESSPNFVTVDPSGRFVYVSDQDNGSISTFTINASTGALIPTTPSGVIAGPDPFGVAVDPSGKFAYVPDEILNAIYMYTVDPTTGALTSNPVGFVSAGNQPSWVAMDPSSRFAYAVNRIDDTVSMYNIGPSTGTLTPNVPSTVETGSGPFSIVVNKAGTFA